MVERCVEDGPQGCQTDTRHGGPMSQLLDGLGAGKIVSMHGVKDGPIVLNMPTPLKALGPTAW